MNREWWSYGPPDDPDLDALERAQHKVIGDEKALAEIAAQVHAKFSGEIDELCSGVYTTDGARAVAVRIADYADAEINQRARRMVDGWAEDRALAKVEQFP